MRFTRAFQGALVLASMALPLAASSAGDDTGQWVTVFYQVNANHQITACGCEDTTQFVVPPKGYIEGFLPRSLFPADQPVTLAQVSKLTSKVISEKLPEEFAQGADCTKWSDSVGLDARSIAKLAATTGVTVTPNSSACGPSKSAGKAPVKIGGLVCGLVDPNDLTTKAGKVTPTDVAVESKNPVTLVQGQAPNAACSLGGTSTPDAGVMPLSSNVGSTLYQGYSSSPAVENAIMWAELMTAVRSNGNPNSAATPGECCEGSVDRALMYGKLTNGFVNEEYARDEGTALSKQGFTNILSKNGIFSSSASAPRGAILVYQDTRKCPTSRNANNPCPGHVAIKTADAGQDGYISDFYSTIPPTSPPFELIGIYVKENSSSQ